MALAFEVLDIGGNGGDASQKLDRKLMAAWLNFANGAFGLTELVDTNGDRAAPDTPFATMMAAAEAVRNNPLSTQLQLLAQRDILERVNGR